MAKKSVQGNPAAREVASESGDARAPARGRRAARERRPAPPTVLVGRALIPQIVAHCMRGTRRTRWEFIEEVEWSESPYHSGCASREIQRATGGHWILREVTRNSELDGVTEEDVEEGALNDDQIQAMRGMTLEKAQNQTSEEVVAIWLDAPRGTMKEEAMLVLCEALERTR
ncbi:MAG: hypothetical protein RI967_474 [Planctomycetota bacterium]|jgi:hypothetical protein